MALPLQVVKPSALLPILALAIVVFLPGRLRAQDSIEDVEPLAVVIEKFVELHPPAESGEPPIRILIESGQGDYDIAVPLGLARATALALLLRGWGLNVEPCSRACEPLVPYHDIAVSFSDPRLASGRWMIDLLAWGLHPQEDPMGESWGRIERYTVAQQDGRWIVVKIESIVTS